MVTRASEMKIFVKTLPNGFCDSFSWHTGSFRWDEADKNNIPALKIDIVIDARTKGQLHVILDKMDIKRLKAYIAEIEKGA